MDGSKTRGSRAGLILFLAMFACTGAANPSTRVAAIVTTYHKNSHADVIVSRLLETETLDAQGRKPRLQLAALYTDQVHPKDISRGLAETHGFPICSTVEEALTLGTGTLAVDGVLLVAEHGDYPKSETGNTQYPKRRLFDEVVKVFEKSGRVVPVFMDKHVADNWPDIKAIYDTSRRLDIPMMAGSSLPVTWRKPPMDLPRGANIEEVVALSFHTLDHYGFHALEFVQALAERRAGGETGIASVQCLSGERVWETLENGTVSQALFDAAWQRLPRHLNGNRPLKQAVKDPTLFALHYADGLRAHIFTLNGAVGEWSAAWKLADGRTSATQFWTQEARPFMHFSYLLRGVESMMLTRVLAWPVERTVLTSGALDALLISRLHGGKVEKTPYLRFAYATRWDWRQPDPPPEPPKRRP